MAYSVPNPVQFENSLGQTLNPGDQVVIVTTGYSHQVGTYLGKYLGLHKNGGVQCEKQVETRFWVFKDTGERVPTSYFNAKYAEQNAFSTKWRAANPGQWNYYSDPEYKTIEEKYMSPIELKSEFVPRRTTLQLNRVYKLAV